MSKVCVVLAMGLLVVSTAGASVLINNGSFEDPVISGSIDYNVTATGWNKSGSVAIYKPADGMSFFGQTEGDQAVLIPINGFVESQSSGIIMTEGVDVTLEFDAAWFGNNGADDGNFIDRFRLYYPNYSGAVPAGYNFASFSPYSKNVGMTTFSYTYTPVAADEGQVWNPKFLPLSGTDVIILDNVQVVPEPATLSLFVLGGIAAVLRRKK